MRCQGSRRAAYKCGRTRSDSASTATAGIDFARRRALSRKSNADFASEIRATYLSIHRGGAVATAEATVHGYTVAFRWWAAIVTVGAFVIED
jgi:hypothetical protein